MRVDKRVAQTVEMSDVSMALTMVVMSAVVMAVSKAIDSVEQMVVVSAASRDGKTADN